MARGNKSAHPPRPFYTDLSWSEGYPTDVGYAATLQGEVAPDAIDLAMLACGRQPPLRAPGFRYVELGCGRGVTLAALAAAYPEAEFLGVDFMPEHIAWARQLAREAGLANVTFEEADFGALASEGPVRGRFDYVALHGVYAWISAENRARVVNILNQWVEPGGAVYVGCNAMPKWAAALPIRRIFRDVLGSGTTSVADVNSARRAVELWLDHASSPAAQAIWDRLRPLSDDYLLHELNAVHGGALWSAELAEDLAGAKLDRVGSVSLAENFDELWLDDQSRQFLEQAQSAGFGNTARDLVAGRGFISDIFSRGAPKLNSRATVAMLNRFRVEVVTPVLTAEKANIPKKPRRALSTSIRETIEALLRSTPLSVGELIKKSDLAPHQTAHAILILIAAGGARTMRPESLADQAMASCARFNAASRERYRQNRALPGVASPLLGRGVPLTSQEQEAIFEKRDPELRCALQRIGIDWDDPGGRE